MKSIDSQDVILEIGAGIGFISANILSNFDVRDYTCVEANPLLCEAILYNHKINKINRCRIINGLLSTTVTEQYGHFYVEKNFWSSSTNPRPNSKEIHVSVYHLKTLLDSFRPTFIICDIEGGEYELFENVNSYGCVKKICIEIHGSNKEKRDKLINKFFENGFLEKRKINNVYFFEK